MDDFIKAAGLILVTVVLCLTLSAQNKYFPMLIAVIACCMVGACALQYIRPILQFFTQLQGKAGWNSELMTVLFKAVGIGILSEITVLICADSGNSALGKALQFLTTAVILWLSIPLFTSLLELLEEILGNV